MFVRRSVTSGIINSNQVFLKRCPTSVLTTIARAASDQVHFKLAGKPHPLFPKGIDPQQYEEEVRMADHTGRQQNHIWSKHEIDNCMSTLYRHSPKTFSDHVMNNLAEDPSVKSIEWRLIVLESIAGVPGFVAAGYRHFHSLRTLTRDHGWIATLLEEAENERMHLLLCLNTFKAGRVTTAVVLLAQYVMVPFLMSVYAVHPKSMHRFVGYLEETACHTYVSIIKNIETPGTQLHQAWGELAAPPMGIGYYHLHEGAKWVDVLKCMMADECNHRDTNHTFADMKSDDPNPFIETHKHNAAIAWRLNMTGEPAWTSPASSDAPSTGATGTGTGTGAGTATDATRA